MATSFIDKWNSSVAFISNNQQEYIDYIENVLIDLFNSDEFIKTNLAGFALKHESESVCYIIAVFKESIPEEFEAVLSENLRFIIKETMKQNCLSDEHVFMNSYPFEMGKDYLNGRLKYKIVSVIK